MGNLAEAVRCPRLLLLIPVCFVLIGAAPATAAELPRLSVERGDDPAIVDDRGREVLLRGINVNQLGDYYAADPALPTVVPLTEEDFARIAALGFDVVRLVVNWSAFQPERDAFDLGYVARIRQALRWAARHGLYVVIDMHQDAWGKFIATPPGTTCPPGSAPAVGWDGAPQWATLTDGQSTCRYGNARELSPAVAQAAQSFFLDREGIQTQLVQTWGRIAAALGGEPNVAGYDLLNEPHPGLLVGPNQSAALGRFYARAIDAIRAGERSAEIQPRIVFFEPSVAWSGFGRDAVPPPGFTADERIVFAPHLYSESISIDQTIGATATTIEQGFDAAAATAALYRAPLWSGEWGWFGDPAATRPRLERYVAQEDARALGGAWWVWRQACGDPHVVGYPGASGSLNPTTCPDGVQQPLVTGYTDVLRRAYPRFAPGRLGPLRSDFAAGTFEVRGSDRDAAGSCRLEVWVPDTGRGEPALSGEGVSELAVRPVPGGFAASGCARGAYVLRGTPGGAPASSTGASGTPRRCASRRRFVVRLRVPREVRLRSVVVRVGSARPRRLRGDRRRVTIDLRGRPRARVVVRLDARARDGRRFSERRVYRTCA
jgi:endoglycosylceramidase